MPIIPEELYAYEKFLEASGFKIAQTREDEAQEIEKMRGYLINLKNILSMHLLNNELENIDGTYNQIKTLLLTLITMDPQSATEVKKDFIKSFGKEITAKIS